MFRWVLGWELMVVRAGAVSDLDWGDKDVVQSDLLTPEQHCKYKFLGHVEGAFPTAFRNLNEI